ncbi:MAG: UDP-3-O-(3-hydroxymyristoyl)glucosamine N-acyltransferase, partial [Opitutae bacterium]|nr:UDP-3-O-(3-hydroxymyristoyl)glucosamine N-acyltransferase [Opitutae bacterium]
MGHWQAGPSRVAGIRWRRRPEAAPLGAADAQSLSFLGDPRLRPYLAETGAGCVIVTDADAAAAQCPVLISDNPYLTFARAARILHPCPPVVGGIHPSAVIDPAARIDPTAWIGPTSVVEA